jgi:hypothetical protein
MDDVFVVLSNIAVVIVNKVVDTLIDLAKLGLAGDEGISFIIKSPGRSEAIWGFGTFVEFVDVFI